MGKAEKRKLNHSQLNQEVNEDLAEENAETIKRPKLFSVKEFRQQIRNETADRLIALNNFHKICTDPSTSQETIHAFLKGGGGCLELLQLLEGENNIPQVLILEIVNYILLYIIAKFPQSQMSAFEACKYLLNTHINLINKMVGLASSAKERRIILKLLTAIVAFSVPLAKDILNNVKFHSGNLEVLTKNTGGDEDCVRYAFIHFLVAFLVDEHYPTISLLLDKQNLLTSVIRGLVYDAHDKVCLFIMSLKKSILENPQVYKTKKMKTFSTPIVRDLVNLYNWKGPKGFNVKQNKKLDGVVVDEYEKSRVSECIHGLLLQLCTSVKYGVIFRDKTLGMGKKHQNTLMFTVLESLERPWEHSYACELVTKICAACPDLVKTMWSNLKPFLEPRDSENWLNAVKFAKALIGEMQPACLEFCWKEYNPQQFAQMVQFLVAPTPILKTIIPESGEFSNPYVKFVTLTLLKATLDGIDGYLQAAENYFPVDYQRTLRGILTMHISSNYPNGTSLLQNWNIPSVKTSPIEHILIILEIFEIYNKLCPQLLDQIVIHTDIGTLLSQINTIDDEKVSIAQNKLINLFLKLEPNLLSLNTEIFAKILKILIQNYHCNKTSEILSTLNSVLKNTGLFEECEDEINIWINAIFDLKNIEMIGSYLIGLLRNVNDNLPGFLEEIREMKLSTDEHAEEEIREILDTLQNEDLIFVDKTILRHNYFSPVILAGLREQINNKSIKIYFNSVLSGVFHLQTNPTFLQNFIIKDPINIHDEFSEYYKAWRNRECAILGKNKGKFDIISKSTSAIMTHNLNLITEADLNLFPELKLNLLRIVMFYLTNLGTNLTKEIQTICLELIKILMGEDFSVVLQNPILLQKFKPTRINKNLLTQFTLEFFEFLQSTQLPYKNYIKPFRSKLYYAVMRLIEKSKIKSDDKLNKLIKIFGFEYEESVNILAKFVNLTYETLLDDSAPSVIYEIISFTLHNLFKLCEGNRKLASLNQNIFVDLCILTSRLNKFITPTSLMVGITEYLNIFPHAFTQIPPDIFISILEKPDYSKETAVLATNILRNRSDLLEVFISRIDEVITKKGVFLPLLDEAIKLNPPSDQIESIYKKFEPVILKALQKPQKAGPHFEKQNCVPHLIKEYMRENSAKGFYEKIQKYEVLEPFLAKMLHAIYLKHVTANERNINSAILTFIHLITAFYKRKTKSEEDWKKLEIVSCIFEEILMHFSTTNVSLEQIHSNETFKLFIKFTLKFGLDGQVCLLKLLGKFVKMIDFDHIEAEELMEMILSHSEFMNVVLGNHSENKIEVFEVLLSLCKRFKNVMKRDHVPGLLGAYEATLRRSDRIILEIFKLYESVPAQTNFYDFRPFLWGNSAKNHYSLKADPNKNLWRQPSTRAVLDILDESWVLNTIKNHPLNISFNPMDNLPGNTKIPIYDISFLLPLFSQILAPENSIPTYKFSRSGALSLTILSLSCNNEDVRKAACHILARFYYHLEAKGNGKDNLLWLRFVEAICKGTAVIENFKLNNFASIFLARMALILTNPQDVMYLPLSAYLGAKSAPNLSSIPELYTFSHSADLNFKEHRWFIYKILHDGLRTDADFIVALKSMAFKLLMENFTSVSSDFESKVMILNILSRACSLKSGANILCNSCGLLSWLNLVALSSNSTAVISKVIEILKNILETKEADIGMIKIIFKIIIEKHLYTKLNDDTIMMLLECLYNIHKLDSSFLNENLLKTILMYISDDYSEYILKYRCAANIQDENNVKTYLRRLVKEFVS